MHLRVLMVVLVGMVVACGGSTAEPPAKGPTTPGPITGGGGGGGGTTGGDTVATDAIDVRDDFFTPPLVRVGVGTTVTWTWRGMSLHDVVLPGGVRSPVQSAGTFRHTFTAAGTYPYNCTLHSGMTGTIIVR